MKSPSWSAAALLQTWAESFPVLAVGRPREDVQTMFSAADRAIVAEVGRALFDESDDLEGRARIEWFVHEVDALFASWRGPAKALALVAPRLLQWSPVLVGWGWFPITSLPRERQAEVLREMENSDSAVLASLFSAIKVLMCTVYLEHPDVLPSMGVDLGGLHPVSHAHKEGAR